MIRQTALTLCLAALAACETASFTPDATSGPLFDDYRGTPEVVRGAGSGGDEAAGTVFLDRNRNGTQDAAEPGLAHVKVSNGREVVLTDADGRYALPKRTDMAVFVIQPSGYQVPHNQNWVPQFAYQHKPNGSPKELRFGGLAPTGPLPAAINFPLIETGPSRSFNCTILGDTQTYANQEIGYFRDSTIDDLLDRDAPADCALAVGDVMGDDLGLIPRMAEIIGTLKTPQWWIHGNHDYDFDADVDEDSADSWRTLWGPSYYAFEIGDVLFIALDNVVYPCTAKDAERRGRDFCVTGDEKRYNARITPDQMAFVENLLALTPRDKRIVFTHHIPFVSFVDMDAAAHQTDNVTDLYALVGDRPALSLSGHTHTVENMAPGDSFAGWQEQVDVAGLPFRHIIVGAGSGAWYNGDFDMHGVPMALQRLGAPKGWLDLSFDGTDYTETYHGANVGRERRMWLSVNTPAFRSWTAQIIRWTETPERQRDPVPPLSINDLPDVKIITPTDLRRGTYVTANIWDGSTETSATLTVAGRTIPMARTQEAQGETARIGPEWADPFALQRQLSVARYAYESRSGQTRNQGFEAFRGSNFGPSTPQPQSYFADRNMHLWRAQLPEDLPMGVHAATVTATDRHGRVTRDVIVIEARTSPPPARFRRDVWDAYEDGAPMR
ncbi:MAG: calcineurin-like phosphoesterase family protein [Pseudomonadota bacterium]